MTDNYNKSKTGLLSKTILSGLFTGYIPFASGTFGSLAALLIWFIPGFENIYIMLSAIIICVIFGIMKAEEFEDIYGKDPSECTIDEFVGMWISLLLVPKQIIPALVAFFIWRILDIIKPFPARNAEKLEGGLGIMADDIISGFYSLLLIHIFLYFYI